MCARAHGVLMHRRRRPPRGRARTLRICLRGPVKIWRLVITLEASLAETLDFSWIPACAGVTGIGPGFTPRHSRGRGNLSLVCAAGEGMP